MVKVFKPVLIWVMSVGPLEELMSRRVFHPVLITSILQKGQGVQDSKHEQTYMVPLFIEHERVYGMVLRGAAPHLSLNVNGSPTDTKLIDRAGDDAGGGGMTIRRHRHWGQGPKYPVGTC